MSVFIVVAVEQCRSGLSGYARLFDNGNSIEVLYHNIVVIHYLDIHTAATTTEL